MAQGADACDSIRREPLLAVHGSFQFLSVVLVRCPMTCGIDFAGFNRRSAIADFTQKLKNDSGVVLKLSKS
jgi:hypothetical protein